MATPSYPTRIVILGGGFAGVHTARHLQRLARRDPAVEITLISKNNYFLMTPLLFEAASGVLEARHAVNPIRKMFKRVRFIEGDVQAIELDRKIVKIRLAHEQAMEVEYEHLVLALGGVSNNKVIPGHENALTFKTLHDAIILRNHCIQKFEEADVESDPERKKALLTFVIIGGGLVGLELQGELTDFIENIRQSYPHVKKEEIRFELIETGPRLIPEMAADLGEYAAKTLQRRGVNVRLNTQVDRLEAAKVFLQGGQSLQSQTIVLAIGVVSNPLVANLPVEKDKKGRMIVQATMRSKNIAELWGLGDCAAIPDPEGNFYPMLAQHALREARRLAKNIIATIEDCPLRPFVYQSKGTLAALGRHKGVGRVYRLKIHGFFAWWVWRSYYLMQMPRLERKLRIMIDWTVALFFKNDAIQLDMGERT